MLWGQSLIVSHWSTIPSMTFNHQIVFKILTKITGPWNTGQWPVYILWGHSLCHTVRSITPSMTFNTPGNVVRDNQKLCKGNLYGSTRPGLMASENCKQTGRCTHFLNLLTLFQLDFVISGNVVLNNFHFCTKQKKVWTWKDKWPIFNLINPEQGVVG